MASLTFLNLDPPSLIDQVRISMQQHGLTPPDTLLIDGQLHRFSTRDGDNSDDAGWYCIYPDGIAAGTFGCWRTGEHVTFRAYVNRDITPEEDLSIRQKISEAKKQHELERIEKNKNAALEVESVWSLAGPVSADYPYLVKKGIQPNGARIAPDGRLMVPLYQNDGLLSSIQYISQSGKKQFHTGGRVAGCYNVLGNATNAKKVFFAEGFATAATIWEAVHIPVFVCYSAGNIPAVVETVRKELPLAELVIVADNDESGTGQKYAQEAATKYGASVVMSPNVGQDVNDYKQAGGDIVTLLSPRSNIFEQLKVVRIADEPDEFAQPDEIIQNLITANRLVVVYGASNSGKTFWTISMAAAVAQSTDFHGRKVDGGPVVYIAAESPSGVRDRMIAYRKHFGSNLDNLYMVSVPLNFHDDPAAASKIITLCKEIEQQTGKKVRMIIGDTLARLSAGANENSGEDMGPIVAQFDAISNETGAAMLIIHHTGKDQARGARGWSGIQCHIDTEIEITDDNGTKAAYITKQRDGEKGYYLYFKLLVIETTVGKFGDMKTTCIAHADEEMQEENPKKKVDPAKVKEHNCKGVFEAAWHASGTEYIEWGGMGKVPYLTRSALRDYLKVLKPDVKEQTLNSFVKQSHGQFVLKPWFDNGKIKAYSAGWVLIDDLEAFSIKPIKRHNETS